MLSSRSPIDRFLRKTLYIQIAAEVVTIRSTPDGTIISEQPFIAVDAQGIIHASGAAALDITQQSHQLTLINPFNHPRLYISDFTAAAKTITTLLRPLARDLVRPGGLLRPIIILHPLRELPGGLAPFEVVAFLELALLIGGKKGYVWIGRDLSEEEVINRAFPEHAGTVFDKPPSLQL